MNLTAKKYFTILVKLGKHYFFFLLFTCSLFSCFQKTEKEIYGCCAKCPEITSDKPGLCPKCGMDLVKKEVMSGDSVHDLDLSSVVKPSDTYVIASIKLVKPENKRINVSYKASGYIDYDSKTISNIASRYSGRIENLYVKYVFQPVKKGQKLFDIYSPEILTAQQNFIYLLKNDSLALDLIAAERKKLSLLGLTGMQLEKIANTKTPESSIPVYCPLDGYIYETKINKIVSPEDNDGTGMNDNSKKTTTSSGKMNSGNGAALTLRQGAYISKGQTLFNVVNTNRVWAILKIYSQDVAKVKLGQWAQVTVNNNVSERMINGKIDFIEPVYQAGSLVMNARVYIENTNNQLKAGDLVHALIEGDSTDGYFVPKDAILDLGKSKIVWVKKNNLFNAHKVVTGTTINDMVEIVSGLTEKDEIAGNAHYLTDSESFIKIAKEHED